MTVSRFDAGSAAPPTRDRWRDSRLNRPNPLWGSNGVTFGPDGRLYIAQYLAGRISALDIAGGDLDDVVPMGGPVQSPDDIAFGADGSLYVADLVPGLVWRRTPEGEYSVVSDQVQAPNGITCVGDRLFVNEMKTNGRVLELFPDGGEPVVLTEGLAFGNAMQLGPDGHLYYPHMWTGQIWRVSPDGGAPELVVENVPTPVGVRFDRGGVLHALSLGIEGFVTRIDLHGSGSRTLLTSGITGIDNAAFDAENRMFVSSYGSGGITEMLPDGRTRDVVPRGFSGPYGVTVDLGGTVYTGDHYRIASPPDTAPDDAVVTHRLRPFAHGITASDGLLHFTSQYGQVETYDPRTEESRVRATGLERPTGIDVRADGCLVVAEADGGRVVSIARDDTVTVLVEGLDRPVDVAHDAEGRCYVSDEARGAVLRIDDGTAVTVAEGLGAPQGLAVLDDTLFTVDVAGRALRSISLTTGAANVAVENLAVGVPPAAAGRRDPALFVLGMPGAPRPFAGLAAAPDGTLLLSANGEGTVVRLAVPTEPRRQHTGTPRSPR
ncbi:hypothetical protein ACIO13_19560 [Streptomyces sp. NPDC087425]|uniref:virginiamycin B lyase family protein n=1 Tax=Streptomyces sp. NPDC087425 TaxID=3365787 RepID=UPI00381DFE31